MVLWGSLIDDRYRIEDELGRGGFGAVYRAKQVVLGTDLRDVALKLFHEGAVGPDNLLEKMNDAISLIGVLNQIDDSTVRQHFIDVYDLGATRGEKPQAFVAMELVRGGSLQRRLHCFGKFNVEQTRDYLIQITRAIGFMHTLPKPVLHRDLKPDNLLLVRHDAGDVVKVADFGLAGAMDGALAVGHAAGALEYMAPEGFDWDTAVPASDVYSIGLIAYEMLFGEHPFAGVGRGLKHDDPKSFGELREMHGNLRRYGVQITKEKAAEALDLSTAPAMIEILNSALEHDLPRRYRNAQQMHEELRREFPEGPGEPPPPGEVRKQMKEEVNYHLRHGDYAKAEKAARNMIAAYPTLAEPYLVLSSISKVQGEQFTDPLKEMFLAQAVRVLHDHMDNVMACEQEELMTELAGLYRQMGNWPAAKQWQEKADHARGGNRP
jgi:serine/threonine protein kinase